MLPSINLLPWREQRRIDNQQRFTHLLGLAIGLACLSLAGGGQYVTQQSQWQHERNLYLQRHLTVLEQQLEQLSVVEKEQQSLLERIKMVEQLKKDRNRTTDFMNLMPKLIPDGVYLDSLKMSGQSIELVGFSESTAHLAIMLDNLEQSRRLTDVEMHSIVHGEVRFKQHYQAYKVSFSLVGVGDERD